MRVVILMSTFNGERYVEEQLRSILVQLPPDGRVIVRDDGSTDQTVARIRNLGDSRVAIILGENIGFARSFLTLMSMAPEDADMYMLSDQDDVWLPVKIERAWEHLRQHTGQAALYCSRMQLVDVNLKPIQLSVSWPRPPSFRNALTENIVTGCTAAFNVATLKLAKAPGDSRQIFFHDWWLYLVVSAFGTVTFDPTPSLLYRQHDGNAIGMGSGIRRYTTILKFLRNTSWVGIMLNQIAVFRLTYFDQLPAGKREVMDEMLYSNRTQTMLTLLVSPHLHRQTFLGEVLFRLLLLVEIPRNWSHPLR